MRIEKLNINEFITSNAKHTSNEMQESSSESASVMSQLNMSHSENMEVDPIETMVFTNETVTIPDHNDMEYSHAAGHPLHYEPNPFEFEMKHYHRYALSQNFETSAYSAYDAYGFNQKQLPPIIGSFQLKQEHHEKMVPPPVWTSENVVYEVLVTRFRRRSKRFWT